MSAWILSLAVPFVLGFVAFSIKAAYKSYKSYKNKATSASFPRWNWGTEYEDLSRLRKTAQEQNVAIITAQQKPPLDERWKPLADDECGWAPVRPELSEITPAFPDIDKDYSEHVRDYLRRYGSADSEEITLKEWLCLKQIIHPNADAETNKDSFFNPKDGLNHIRILPPFKDGHYFATRRQHYTTNGQTHQCGKKLAGDKWVGDCPICDYYNKLWQQAEAVSHGPGEEMRAQAQKIKPVERYYYNVLVKGESKAKIYSAGRMVHQQIIASMLGDNLTEALGDVSHPVTGRDLCIKRSMKGCGGYGPNNFPSYDLEFSEPSPLGTKEDIIRILCGAYDLEAVAKRWEKTPEELKAFVESLRPTPERAYSEYDHRKAAVAEAEAAVPTVHIELDKMWKLMS